MKNTLFLLILFVSFTGFSKNLNLINNKRLNTKEKQAVNKFISLVSQRDWVGLSQTVSYPLRRGYPLEQILNQEDFLAKQNELFDDNLIEMITNSHPDSNWYSLGTKGVRLMKGEIWLNNAGLLVGINYKTEHIRLKESAMIEDDRETLPVYLQEYERPILKMDVGKWIFRIDQTEEMSYRFIGWLQGRRNPSVDVVEIIFDGNLEYRGTDGSHTYTFTNDFGTFKCNINETPEEGTPEGELVLYRDEKVYRRYPAIKIER